MEDRKYYLESILTAESVLEQVSREDRALIIQSLDREKHLVIVNRLEALDSAAARSRAEFIRQQMSGDKAGALFDKHREAWGIPNFKENLVTVEDFHNGFMWRFRDHTTSWSENQYAQQWFLTSVEARTTTMYELWACDDGQAACIDTIKGPYKQILQDLLENGVYEVLISPVLTKEDLHKFINTYSEEEGDFAIEDIMEDYIRLNPNFETE